MSLNYRSTGSVHSPKFESALLPANENAKRGDGTGVQCERRVSWTLVDESLTPTENADNSIPVLQKALLSSCREDSVDNILGCARPISSIISSTLPARPLAQVSDRCKLLRSNPSLLGNRDNH
jgi:hypothetical protein